jgi:hypothetical protein
MRQHADIRPVSGLSQTTIGLAWWRELQLAGDAFRLAHSEENHLEDRG